MLAARALVLEGCMMSGSSTSRVMGLCMQQICGLPPVLPWSNDSWVIDQVTDIQFTAFDDGSALDDDPDVVLRASKSAKTGCSTSDKFGYYASCHQCRRQARYLRWWYMS